MEEFNDRAYDAWRTHHWTDEPEPDLPEIDDPRVVDIWEEPEDWGDEYPLPRYARVYVKFKPWKNDDYTETLRYLDYIDETKKYRAKITEEVSKAYFCETLVKVSNCGLEIREKMEQIKKHLTAIEEHILAGRECGAREEKRMELVEQCIVSASLCVGIMELYTLIMRNSFPWVEPMVSHEIAEAKKKLESMQQLASEIREKIRLVFLEAKE